jgi:hypothetical protein
VDKMKKTTKDALFYPLIPVAMIFLFLFFVDSTSKNPVPVWFYLALMGIFYIAFAGIIVYERERKKTIEEMTEEEKIEESKIALRALLISLIVTFIFAIWASYDYEKSEFSLLNLFGIFRVWIIILAIVWGLLEGWTHWKKRKN